jgi:hypothetical protein
MDAVNCGGIQLFKCGVFLFYLAPYIALRIAT